MSIVDDKLLANNPYVACALFICTTGCYAILKFNKQRVRSENTYDSLQALRNLSNLILISDNDIDQYDLSRLTTNHIKYEPTESTKPTESTEPIGSTEPNKEKYDNDFEFIEKP